MIIKSVHVSRSCSDTIHLASYVAVIFHICKISPDVSEGWETSMLKMVKWSNFKWLLWKAVQSCNSLNFFSLWGNYGFIKGIVLYRVRLLSVVLYRVRFAFPEVRNSLLSTTPGQDFTACFSRESSFSVSPPHRLHTPQLLRLTANFF